MAAYSVPGASTGEVPVGLTGLDDEASTGIGPAFLKESVKADIESDFDAEPRTSGEGASSSKGKKEPKKHGPKAVPREQTDRFNLRNQMSNAVEAAERLVRAVEENDAAEMVIAGREIVESLGQAAKYKRVRERNWFQALTVAHSVIAGCEFDRIGIEVALCFKNCVELLSHSGLDRTDLNALRRDLRSVDLNPWSGISPKEDSTDE